LCIEKGPYPERATQYGNYVWGSLFLQAKKRRPEEATMVVLRGSEEGGPVMDHRGGDSKSTQETF